MFLTFFSGVLDWIVLILVWFERSRHSAQVSGQILPWPLKLMTSREVESTWMRTGGCRRFRGEWVNGPETVCASRWPLISTNQYYLRSSSGINSRTCLFNLYVDNLSSALPSEVVCHQYADDTTMYIHFRPSDLEVGQSVIQDALNKLSDRSLECNLALNPKKTKLMMLTSTQMSRAHGLETRSVNLKVNGKRLERASNFRLLGTQVNQHLN